MLEMKHSKDAQMFQMKLGKVMKRHTILVSKTGCQPLPFNITQKGDLKF